MKKVGVFGDLHMNIKTSTRENIGEALLKKLSYCALICENLGVEDVFFAGDFFDNVGKYLPASLMVSFAEELKKFKKIYYITGNHDWHKSLNYTWEDEPIGLLHEMAGNMVNLNSSSVMIEDFTVVGREWEKQYDLGKKEKLECPKDLDPNGTIMLTHSYLLPEEKNIMGMYTSYESLENPCRMYWVGHYHEALGELIYPEDRRLLVMGSIIRNKTSEVHIPQFYIYTFDGSEIVDLKTIEIPHDKMEEVFVDTSSEKTLTKLKEGISGFVSSLQKSRTVMSREDFMSIFAEKAKDSIPEKATEVISFTQHIIDEKLN